MRHMLNFLKRRQARRPEAGPEVGDASIGEDRRVYAIGDIHGRVDLFDTLLEKIAADHAMRPPKPHGIILLGDLIDRGPQSAQTVERALQLRQSGAPVRILKGNHEEIFLLAARGDVRATRFLCRIGGGETLFSYGLSQADYDRFDTARLTGWMADNIPRAHIDFIDSFEDYVEMGDYLFVHAGIRPQVKLEEQRSADLRWIREEFLAWPSSHGRIIVHGHTINDDVDEQRNRIGIDTGAYRSGKLTAIGLEGKARWYIGTTD